MKLLIPDWKSFGKEDIQEAFEKAGHTVSYITEEPHGYRQDPRFKSQVRQRIREEKIDAVFSSNYYPILSAACQDTHIPYISWCYDSPLVLTYSRTIRNACNYVFLFDSHIVEELQALGASHVYYLPMAANTDRTDALHTTIPQKQILETDVAFVGSLYNETHTLYDRITNLDAYTQGYLEGIMEAQRHLYGCHFIDTLLTPEIIHHLEQAMPLQTSPDGLESLSYLYSNYFLCRKMTERNRLEILDMLESMPSVQTHLYTPGATPQYHHIQNLGTLHYMQEMPLAFRHSRINLNITLRSIQAGIPLRSMDIMGAGGFLLTNYQCDMDRHFIEGEDYVCYDSLDDLQYKIDYYLAHDEERKTIAAQGHTKVQAGHTYDKRIQYILDTVFS